MWMAPPRALRVTARRALFSTELAEVKIGVHSVADVAHAMTGAVKRLSQAAEVAEKALAFIFG